MANGFLQQIVVKDTSAGKMTDYIFSNGDKVGAGKFPPKGIEQGKFYNYEFDMNGNFKNLRKNTMFEGKAPEGASAASATSSAAPARATGGNSYDSRQDVISKQAAFNTSIAFVKLLAESDALPIAASVKAAKKADAIEAIVLDYASKFHKRSTGTALNFDDEALAAVGDLSEVDAATSWNE